MSIPTTTILDRAGQSVGSVFYFSTECPILAVILAPCGSLTLSNRMSHNLNINTTVIQEYRNISHSKYSLEYVVSETLNIPRLRTLNYRPATLSSLSRLKAQ